MARRFLACTTEEECVTRMRRLLELQKRNGQRLRFLRFVPTALTCGYLLVICLRTFVFDADLPPPEKPDWSRAVLETIVLLSTQAWLFGMARNVLVENDVLDVQFDHVIERNYVLASPLGPTIVPLYVRRIDAFRFNWEAEAEAKEKGQAFVAPPLRQEPQ